MKITNHQAILFLMPLAQITLVSANTVFITNRQFIGVAITSFLISYIWTFNVQRISASSTSDRIIYSAGAMVGALLGLYGASSILKFI